MAACVSLLAVVETAQALIAPTRAPSDADWAAAERAVRADFLPGDLIVAAPAWADPIMRMHLGDLLPIATAARMDDARYARLWEVSQRGVHAQESSARALTSERRFGALTVRRLERRPAEVTFDFLERWQDAYVTEWSPGLRSSTPCPWQVERFVCPASGGSVHRELVEVDTRIRRAILAPPVVADIVAVEFPAVTLGRELAVTAGLHDVWSRKSPGSVFFEVWIAGQPVDHMVVDNRSGWGRLRIDTAARDGQTVPVRFQISSPRPQARLLAFAAEARR
jgi:hypothetical protein